MNAVRRRCPIQMLRIVRSKAAVKAKMKEDGVDSTILDLDPSVPLPPDKDPDTRVELQSHPAYGKVRVGYRVA